MIAFSYHQDCFGKPEKRIIDNRITLWIGDQRINLGYGWRTCEMSFEDLFEFLTVDGCAIAPALTCDHREESTFVSHQLAMVDIDSGMTIAELQQHPFYQLYGSGFYTTASHTDQDPRFRILYRLPVPVEDAYTMRVIYEGLLAVHGCADIACKDAARLFYGTQNAQHRERTDRMMDAQALEIVVEARDIEMSLRQPVTVRRIPAQPHTARTPEQVGELLDQLRKYYPDLNYATRRDVTWAVAGALSSADTVSVMRARWDDSDKTARYETLINERKRDDVTLGTVYHMIRQYDSAYGKKPQYMSMDELKNYLKKETT